MTEKAASLIGLTLLVVVLGMSGIGAATMPGNSTDSNSTADADHLIIDDQVQLTDWEYQDGTFVLTFKANVPREIVLTEAISTQESQSGQLSIKQRTLPRGESTIRMSVDGSSSEAALTISSRQGTKQGRAVFVSTGQTASSDASPFAGTSSTAGWIGGAVLALVSVVLAGTYKLRRESREPEVAQ